METEGRKILIVDDDREFAMMVGRFLDRRGFQVSVDQDGNSALEKLSSELPELVLLDVKSPDITGMEILRRIKESSEDTAVIIIAGDDGEQVAVDFMKAGALDFLSKTIDHEILLNRVRNALRIRDAQVEGKQLQRYSPLEKFFPFLAHQIRNPLHAIGGALAIIQRRSDMKDELIANSIKNIQEEGQHLHEFVQESLDFVRPTAKNHFGEIDINEVISIVINIVSHVMFQELSKKIRITTDIDCQLPKIYANYDEIRQAILNIVKNSFEAMCGGGELIIKSAFKSDPQPGWIQIVFTDNGPGIKEENMKHPFSPFFTTKLRGTGLGLAICQRIIAERHKGKIHVRNGEGKGTIVTVELPIRHPMDIAQDK